MSPAERSELARRLGRSIGFDLVGFARAAPVATAAHYRDWLAAGYGGSMAYLARHADLRADPRGLLENARSVIATAVSYRRPEIEHGAPGALSGRVAQYARGADYHAVMRRMLRRLISDLRTHLEEPFEAREFVDTGPLLERALGAAAGLGWIGKNTLLLHQRLGSFVFLGEIVTDLELAPDPLQTDHCGTCTRCLEACPTGAFAAPRVLDSTRCIAYLTIEHRSAFSQDAQRATSEWVFGCDVCQDVCPFNADAPAATQPEIAAERIPARLDLPKLAALTPRDYRALVRDTAADRANRSMWRRNALAALGNAGFENPTGQERRRAALTAAVSDPDRRVAGAARQALSDTASAS